MKADKNTAMILREQDGEGFEVIEAIGPGDVEALKAGVSHSADEMGQPIWDEVLNGKPWPTAADFETQDQ